ncbi:MAG: M48 family metalloprotease [Nitrososphaerota archaeon]|nr:M48 family metalloprotease [Nitrososphaerota archaeon]MDG7023732.1 M48 family metalloprotease [Nitrososphaerota archaeon]
MKANLISLGAIWDYIYGTFRIRRLLLLSVALLSWLFTVPVLVMLPGWTRVDLIYLYVGLAYVTGFCMYGAFRHPLKTILASVFLGWRYKSREFTPEAYRDYGVTEIVNAMGIKKKVRVYVTPNPWIEGPYTDATRNKVYIPLKWMNRFPRLDMRGVLGHEIGHIKTKGRFIRELIAMVGGIAGVTFLLGTYSISIITVTIFEFALAFLVLTFFSWRNELRADLEGAKVTGPEGLISIFEQLKAEGHRDDPSETHPSLSDRIARLSVLLPLR